MGSPQTLDPTPTRPPDPDRHVPDGRVELLAHLQTPAAFGGGQVPNASGGRKLPPPAAANQVGEPWRHPSSGPGR